jgi:hypothetical protein
MLATRTKSPGKGGAGADASTEGGGSAEGSGGGEATMAAGESSHERKSLESLIMKLYSLRTAYA